MKPNFKDLKSHISDSNLPISICVYLMRLVDYHEKLTKMEVGNSIEDQRFFKNESAHSNRRRLFKS